MSLRKISFSSSETSIRESTASFSMSFFSIIEPYYHFLSPTRSFSTPSAPRSDLCIQRLDLCIHRSDLGVLHYSVIILRNSFSERMGTPRRFALSYFDPGFSPATRKSVLPDTEPTTCPPSTFILFFASSRDNVLNVPVRTKVLPASGAVVPRATFTDLMVTSLRRRCKSFLFSSSRNQR